MQDKKSSVSRYSAPTVLIHWLTLLAFIGLYAAINLTDLYPKGSDTRQLLRTAHISLGLIVFGLVLLRLVFRFAGATPVIVPEPPAWQEKLAKLGHLALYGLMVLMPLLGWAGLSARGKSIPFFGVELPALIAENHDLGRTLMDIHEALGNIGYFLIGIHAAAALYHHYFLKDNTLQRMRLR